MMLIIIILCLMQQDNPLSSDSQDLQAVQQQEEDDSYITSPQQFLDFCLKDKKIKVMDECNPIWNHVYLKDISLHKKGPLQDKIYAKVGKYYRNIRRGNTLCQIYHDDQNNNAQQQYDIFFCRRGMKKFYDLEPEYLQVGSSLSTHHRLMKNRIFESLDKQLENPGAKYHLYRLFKENGEHCQIGYIRQLDSWLFASKNVAILAKTSQDLEENYHKERFYWAKLVGEEFFRVLSTFSQEKQENFKKDIDGFTLLGQHCGNEKHQHITKYDKVEIIFYGLVCNTGRDHCQSVEKCKAFLKKYNLKMSLTIERKGLYDKNTILSNMYEMLKEVAEGTMEKQGQGSVMYIVCEREGKERTIGMCKLKTSQYLIYRRLREMLKLNVSKKGLTANNFEKFKYDIEQMVSNYFKPPKELQFYFQLGEKAFQQAASNADVSETYLRYKFVDFLSQFEKEKVEKSSKVIVACNPKRILLICLPRIANTLEKYCKSKEIEVDYMYRPGKSPTKTTLHILYMIPRLGASLEENTEIIIPTYDEKDILLCIQQLETCKDISKSHLITFIKSTDKGKSVRMLNNKIQAARQSFSKQSITFSSCSPSQENLIAELRKKIEIQVPIESIAINKSQIKKYVIIPMLIPGSGKSSLAENLIKCSNYPWKVVDTDNIRRKIMEKFEEVNLNNDKSQQLFFQSKEDVQEQYLRELKEEIKSESSENTYLYIDRLCSPYNIAQKIDEVREINKEAQIIILTQTYIPVKLNDFVYPFSMNYLLTCLKRCLQRQEHKTMLNNPYEVAKLVLKFYQNFANFNEKIFLKSYPLKVQFVKLSFIEDGESSYYMHQNIKKTIEECLSMIEPGKSAKDSNAFIKLIEQLYKYGGVSQQASIGRKYNQLRVELQKQIWRIQ